ncbi:CoA transferase [Lentzea sp. NPDC042327]|uniref:CoA transferase n=1 Tax=Lentzea sp. NPDC042327 TaxID=3154801 RepID=UPI0033CF6C65
MTEATALHALALEGATASVSGTSAAARVLRAHLRALGAEVHTGFAERPAEAVLVLDGGDRHEVVVDWAGPVDVPGLRDEATVQAACGVMHVHGRRSGSPRGLGVDHCGTAAGVLAVTGLLAAVLRGAPRVRTSVAEAALLTVSQYLAAAGADEAEAVDLRPGGPPFTTADGVRFEVEALVPEVWAAFWAALGTDSAAVRAGWRPYQFRYATATAPIPEALHAATRAVTFAQIATAAMVSGASVCRVHRPVQPLEQPWSIRPTAGVATCTGDDLVVYEAGRRIQAPMAAHLLGLLGAKVIRVEPPGGDPLRGMPPMCRDLSARWLALNRGKDAVEVDLKDPADRQRLRYLLVDADVFLHNWAPGNAERWRLTAADLPDGLVYAHTSGWGGGDLVDPPLGTDFMVQARTGLAELVRPADEEPAPSLMTLVDVLGGLIGAEAVLAGVLTRRRTGRGVAVESSLLGAAGALLAGAKSRPSPGFRVPVDGRVGGVDVLTDLAALPGDPRFAAVLGRDDRGCPALGSPWRFL